MAKRLSAPLEEVIENVSNPVSRIEPILTGLAASGPEEREEASETIVDWLSTLTSSEASQVGAALVTVVLAETDSTAKEAELNALGELAGHGLLTRDDVLPLATLGRPTPGVTGREHLDYLNEEFELWSE
ncbi:hypothetical protein ABIA31_002069 [Catenulispora sp. MAP5-51]|uniref:hypothetical protein n=1 Tax=Catenulispora sp. MAP5-51 TaxID=3156298 RepID=UPI00351905FA